MGQKECAKLKKDGAAGIILSFVSVLRSPVTPFDKGKTKSANLTEIGTVSKSATFLATESVSFAPSRRGETKARLHVSGHPDIRLRIGLSFTRSRFKCTLSGAIRKRLILKGGQPGCLDPFS